MEVIFSNLRDNQSLLECRSVNHRWKYIVDGMLQRGIGQNSCTLLPNGQLENVAQLPVIPKLFTYQNIGSTDLTKTFCPQYIVKQGRRQASNPFPSKSLHLKSSPVKGPTSDGIYENKSLIGFMSNFGHHLTVLWIGQPIGYWDSLNFRETDFVFILSRTPNLKALKLIGVRVESNQSARKQKLPLLQHLTSLKILNSRGTSEKLLFGGHSLTAWLLQTYSKQLTCLQVDSDFRIPMRFENYPKLSELSVSVLSVAYLLPSDAIPLRRLVIANKAYVGESVPFVVLTDFMEKFSSTLEYMELPLRNSRGYLDKLQMDSRNRVSGKPAPFVQFPRLKTFGIECYAHAEDWHLAKQNFFPKFPVLEVLNFGLHSGPLSALSEDRLKLMVTQFLTKQAFWKNCKQLSRINVFCGTQQPLLFLVDDLKLLM